MMGNRRILNRRGISQIVGTLLMLGVVGVVGSVILIKGIQVVTDFNASLNTQQDPLTSREKIVIMHVTFHDNNQADIYVMNAGYGDAKVASITVVNVAQQSLVFSPSCSAAPVASTLLQLQSPIMLPTITLCSPSTYTAGQSYKISVITANDNSFTRTVVAPNG